MRAMLKSVLVPLLGGLLLSGAANAQVTSGAVFSPTAAHRVARA